MPEANPSERFPILDSEQRLTTAQDVAALAIQVSQLTEDFVKVQRVPRYATGERENDVEHSFMLAIAAPEIARMLNLDLDEARVRDFAIVHDLIEIKTGDYATFNLSKKQMAEKELIQAKALEELASELPEKTAKDLEEYERQDTREAVFVRMVDKLLPVAVDITGQGKRILSEDYGVSGYESIKTSHNKLHKNVSDKFSKDFPDLVAAHAVLCKIFEQEYVDDAEQEESEVKPRAPDEVELKFLIDEDDIPDELFADGTRSSHLRQGYVAIGSNGSETRVRSFDDERFELTVKSPGTVHREESTNPIDKELFDALWAQTEGRRVEKTRHYIPYNGQIIELDIYENDLDGLITAEVEFDGRLTEAKLRADTFEPPDWFGKNISEDLRYKNQNLAQHPPHEPLVLGNTKY